MDKQFWATVAVALFGAITAIATTTRAIMAHKQNKILLRQINLKQEELDLRKSKYEQKANNDSGIRA